MGQVKSSFEYGEFWVDNFEIELCLDNHQIDFSKTL